MTKKQKKNLIRILFSAVLLVTFSLLPTEGAVRFILFLIPYLIAGYDVLLRAIKNISKGQVFDENFLMSIATIGAFILAEYSEAVFVMIFYQIGEWFQSYAVGRSRKSIADLMDIRPDYANVERDGQLVQVDPEDVAIGDVIVVKPGEKVPLDGIVLEGFSTVDTSALTGESIPRDIKNGDNIISGCINKNGLLKITVTKAYGDSTVSKILDLVENAGNRKAKTENFITKFARYYTPIVVLSAVLVAVIPPLLLSAPWSVWFENALIFLVVSCPCALVISVPLSFFGGIGGASRAGILVKGANYLEALASPHTVVFDKTGTLTHGNFKVTAIHPEAYDESALLEYAALAESYSDHPISLSLKEAYKKPLDASIVENYEEIAGKGVRAVIKGHSVCAGNEKLMDEIHAAWHPCHISGTIVHVAIDGEYAGHIVITDEIKADSADTIQRLKQLGVQQTILLSGDTAPVAESVGHALRIDQVHAELLPSQKVERFEQLMQEKQGGGSVVFVGDGINDAPVLSRADVGIAMGGLGSDAAIEAADIVLMDDKPSKIASAISIARRTLRIVRQNIVFSLAVKIFILILSALGMGNMWAAIIADVGVMVIAVINSMRTLNAKEAFSPGVHTAVEHRSA